MRELEPKLNETNSNTPDVSRREFIDRLRQTAVVAVPVVAVVALQTPKAMAY